MWTTFKVFIEFVTMLLLLFFFFNILVFWHSFPNQGLNPRPLHWKAKS